MQMANKYMQKCLIVLIIRQLEIQPQGDITLPQLGQLLTERFLKNALLDVEKGKFLHTVSGNVS